MGCGLESETQAQHKFIVVRPAADFILFTTHPGADFIIAQAHKAAGGVNGEIFIETVGRAHVPGEVGETVVHGELVAVGAMDVKAGIIEGQPQSGADVGREGRILMEIPEQVGKELCNLNGVGRQPHMKSYILT